MKQHYRKASDSLATRLFEIDPMFATTVASFELAPLAVNCPGGLARQYRVQQHDPCSASGWRLYASFREQWHAQQCLEDLQCRGIQARIVAYSSLPTAG